MSSTNSVNFSVRQNKSIEREIVFDGIGRLMAGCNVRNPMYVGFGSVWFADFVLAHRRLGVSDMHSIEMDPMIAARARFNRPFRTVRIHPGSSEDVLPELLSRVTYMRRPWIVWLDYDRWLERAQIEEIEGLIRDLPADSFLITTFSAQFSKYGRKPKDRVSVLGELLGYEVDPTPTLDEVKDPNKFMPLLARLIENHLHSSAIRQGRVGGYVPSFRISYKDGVPMATVGGFLPSEGNAAIAKRVVGDPSWPGRPNRLIAAPPLTAKEVAALLSRLPSKRHLSRPDIQRLGFDLDEEQLALFEEHYLRYPIFVQAAT